MMSPFADAPTVERGNRLRQRFWRNRGADWYQRIEVPPRRLDRRIQRLAIAIKLGLVDHRLLV